jgi:hypothetical protein
MTEHDISQLKNFSIPEKDIFGRPIFGDSYIISADLMYMVDDMVTFCKQEYPGSYCIVHDINRGDHTENSLHYQGKAIYLHMGKMTLGQTARIAMRYFFGGVGLYPEWAHPGVHLDVRHNPTTWLQLDGKYIYIWSDFEKALIA